LNRLTAGAIAPTVSQSSNILANAQPLGDRANFFSKGDVAVSAAVKGKKAAPKKAAPKKVAAKKTAPKKVAAKKAALRKPKQVENLTAGAEVRRKFTMTVQVSGREFLDDPVAATRRVLILALAQIPVKIHEEQVDNESIYKVCSTSELNPTSMEYSTTQRTQQVPATSTHLTCGNGGRRTSRKYHSRSLGFGLDSGPIQEPR
jgi:hypothetical protein